MTRRLLLLLLLALAPALVGATEVRLPPQRDGSGTVLPHRVTITLVGADRRTSVVGVASPDLATEYRSITVDDAAGEVVTLAPTLSIQTP